MMLAAKLDDLGTPAWIALTVVSFLIWWPLGLVALGYLVGSGRMARWTGCGARHGARPRKRPPRRWPPSRRRAAPCPRPAEHRFASD